MFRQEAISQSSNALNGDVFVRVPLSWQSIGYLIFGGVAAGLLFLSLASYSRVEIVTGAITPDIGVAAILPTRSGTISNLAVTAGQTVPAGAVLATIRAEEDSATGLSTAAQIEAAIARQDASLSAQTDAALSSARAQQSQLAAQRSGLEV